MFSKVKSCAVHGVDGRMIDVEADVNDGLPVFTMVGYLSSSVRESSERVRTALKNSGFHLPPKRITINLSPADMRKDGSGYDLAIATAVLLSLGVTAELPMEQTLVLGELSLDGSIKAIPGVLPMVICAREEGMTSCIVPKENVQEAALVQGISVIGVSSLKETMEYIQGIKEYENTNVEQPAVDTSEYLYDIDFSDVVGQESIKRGMEIACIHFFSYPYTSELAKEKVLELAHIMTKFCGRMTVDIVGFTEIQEAIRDHCREEYFTIIMRRFMMRIAEAIGRDHGAKCLVTGENLGQVASQTMDAMAVTGAVVHMPIFHPLIGMDKEEIVTVARRIGTLETSILPYEDCCTVFTPKHPKTKPVLAQVEAEEQKLDVEGLIARAIANTEKTQIRYYEDEQQR